MSKQLLDDVKRMYDETSEYWSKTRSKKLAPNGSKNWPVVQKYLDGLKSDASVLDVGCGNGRLVSGITEQTKYLGIDFSSKLLDEARKDYPDREFRVADITEESAWDAIGKYDAIFCVAVLHHIPERSQQIDVLKKMRAATKKNGFLFLSVWNLWQERFLQHHLDSTALKKINPRWVEIPFNKNWKRFCVQMDIPYLVELLTEADYEIDEIYFADKHGEKCDIQTGQNLVVLAKPKED